MVGSDEELPLNVVGSSTFGLYPKISWEQTHNMFVSDGWMVNYAGYRKRAEVLPAGEGRGLFHSVRNGFTLGVFNGAVYRITTNFGPQFVGNIETFDGEVSIAQNLANQICIVDGVNAYIYNLNNGELTQQALGFTPSYVSYHNTFFLLTPSATDAAPQNWYAYEPDAGDNNLISLVSTKAIQTKADTARVIQRLPGSGNNIIVVGAVTAEFWTQVGGIENYRRSQSNNLDVGTVSKNTFAVNDKYCMWLAQNETDAPYLILGSGSQFKQISTDGISGLMEALKRPDKSTAFFYRQNGHLFYQITFFDPEDNLSLFYDVEHDAFYHTSDENQDYHPARQIVYNEQKTIFVSLNDASIYELSQDITDYNYTIDDDSAGYFIPRTRICKRVSRPNSKTFKLKLLTVTMEQGVTESYLMDRGDGIVCFNQLITEDGQPIITETGEPMLAENGYCTFIDRRPAVDLSISYNGGETFGLDVRRHLNARGTYRNTVSWHGMGMDNEATFQFRFWGLQRFVVGTSVLQVENHA